MFVKNLVSLCTVATFIGLVDAGPGANMEACLYFPRTPSTNFTVNIRASSGTDRCMNAVGSSSSIWVNRQGLICTSIGYVEAKTSSSGGDLCATDESHWGLSWKTPDDKYSGSTDSRWYSSNKITLHGQSANTYVCSSDSQCTDTSKSWSGTGKLWIIFEPNAFRMSGLVAHQEIEQQLLAAEDSDL